MKKFSVILAIILFVCSCGEKYRQPSLPYLPQNSTIVAFGDSLTYGQGASRNQNYPAELEKLINRKVINVGINGLTTAGGLKKLPEILKQYHPQLIIIGLGGNDMLRKVDTVEITLNLRQMVQMSLVNDAKVLLLAAPKPGITLNAPKFYLDIAKEYNIPIDYESLSSLESKQQYKSDAIHLNAEGYKILAKNIAQLLKKLGAL